MLFWTGRQHRSAVCSEAGAGGQRGQGSPGHCPHRDLCEQTLGLCLGVPHWACSPATWGPAWVGVGVPSAVTEPRQATACEQVALSQDQIHGDRLPSCLDRAVSIGCQPRTQLPWVRPWAPGGHHASSKRVQPYSIPHWPVKE